MIKKRDPSSSCVLNIVLEISARVISKKLNRKRAIGMKEVTLWTCIYIFQLCFEIYVRMLQRVCGYGINRYIYFESKSFAAHTYMRNQKIYKIYLIGSNLLMNFRCFYNDQFVFYFFIKNIYVFLLKGGWVRRDRGRERSSIHWFIPLVTMGAGLVSSQEPEIVPGPLHWYRGPKLWTLLSCLPKPLERARVEAELLLLKLAPLWMLAPQAEVQ